MLIPLDDYPVHQTPEPLVHPATGDRNVYDRYFFNGYAADGSLFFAAALGVYPNRSVIDAAFSVVHNGVQTSVHASGRAPADRARTEVGPVAVDVLEPLRRLAVRVGDNPAGVEADLTFTARSQAIEEPRFTYRVGGRTVMDYTRLTQFGAWAGRIEVDGDVTEVDGLWGCRDRSWGVRRVGEREVEAPGPEPQFFWLWAPLNFEDRCLHFDVQEDGHGRRWHANGDVVPVVGAPGDAWRAGTVDHQVTWRPGTRRAGGAVLRLTPEDGREEVVELEPVLDFQMLGLGYLHPEWGHGMWKGEEAVAGERWELSELDPLALHHLHVQSLCRARWGEREGMGILEQLVIGPHAPSGLTGLAGGAPG